MNNRNKDLFFNDENEVTITISPEDSEPFEVEIIAHMEIEEYSQEYVAALPLEPIENLDDNEVILLKYFEDEDGNPQFEGITDDQELEEVASAFEQYFDQAEFDVDNEDDNDDYLGDIGSYVPGVTIK